MNGWQKSGKEYRRMDGETIYGYVCQYDEIPGWNWQAVRGTHRLHGSVETMQEAMEKADAALALSNREFNNQLITEKRKEIARLEKEIKELAYK